MRNKILLVLLSCTPIFLVSCSNSNNDNFDLSNLRIPTETKNKISPEDIGSSINKPTEIPSNRLVAYPKASKIIDSVKFGKIDPFAEENIKINNLNSDFKIKGFLSTNNNKYVLVSYLGKEGTISAESIGGVNTFLLPDGAKVINIDTKDLKLIIKFENEDYIFEL